MKRVSIILWLLAGFFLFPQTTVVWSEEPSTLYGPRFELGPGAGISSESGKCLWVPDSYQIGMLTAGLRLYKGLGIQGGIEFGRGNKSNAPDSLTYGDNQLQIHKRMNMFSRWAGVRYELPMSVFRSDVMGIHSVYGVVGLYQTDYGVASSQWTNKGVFEQSERSVQFRTAKMTGPYYLFAARWKIDSPDTEGIGSWIGSYGVDLGFRYNANGSITMKHSNIIRPTEELSSFQVFLVVFLKVRLFE
jgi:hypothetical protein